MIQESLETVPSVAEVERDGLLERALRAEEDAKTAKFALSMARAEHKAKERVWIQFALAKQRPAACVSVETQKELAKKEREAFDKIEEEYAAFNQCLTEATPVDEAMQSLVNKGEVEACPPNASMPAAGARNGKFSPRVSVYDHEDLVLGLRRIVRIEAPGRSLSGDGRASVTGTVRRLENGVYVHLKKVPDIPGGAIAVVPFGMPDAPGSWEWTYQPSDGNWQLCNTWGFSHGIFALALQRNVPDSDLLNEADVQPEAPAVPIFGTNFIPATLGGSAVLDKLCATLIAPAHSASDPLLQLQQDTIFITEEFRSLPARDVTVGSFILGPDGWLEVSDVQWEPEDELEVAIISMGEEVLSVAVCGARVLAAASTADGAAAADWAAYDARELRAGDHEVALQAVPGDAEVSAQVTAVRLSSLRGATLTLRFEDAADAIFVLPGRCAAEPRKAVMRRRRDLQPDFTTTPHHRNESSPFQHAIIHKEFSASTKSYRSQMKPTASTAKRDRATYGWG